ncbi:MAG: ribonuclease Z [Myxococcales bacterium]|nr:ribonuclease Z [Myxococcales bacterium]
MPLTFVPLGVGDAFSALHYSSCLAVEAEGSLLLVDCPHPIQKMMREAAAASGRPLELERLAGVAITHLHADHSSGLESLAYFFHFALQQKLVLLAHPSVSERLWEGHLAAGMERLEPPGAPPSHMRLEDYFQLVPVREDAPARLGPFRVECRRTAHHIPTTAFRVRAGGRSLGVSADTSYDPSLIAWLSEADLFVHETGHGVHTPYEALAELPDAVRAKMRLGHFPDWFLSAPSSIERLEEGRAYVV